MVSKYLVCRRSEHKKMRQWFSKCQIEKRPYIVVANRTKFADIRFDNTTFSEESVAPLNVHAAEIQKQVSRIFEKYAQKSSRKTMTDVYVFFDNLPRDVAEQAAAELYDLISSFLPTQLYRNESI